MTTNGISIKPFFFIKFIKLGNSARGKPKIRCFLASKCVPINIPVKYNMAGTTADNIITEKGTFKYSIIINAAAPINGGIICPPVDADASVAAANSGLKPAFLIIGIVKDPKATVFQSDHQESIPFRYLAALTAYAFTI